MIYPLNYIHEKERLNELYYLGILDTIQEEIFDGLTQIASTLCDTPISLISLIDDKRQWFKSNHGLNVRETNKKYSFCAHALHTPDDFFVVEDSRTDPRFTDNPLVKDDPNVIFYAGYPIVTENGLPIGSFCVIDNHPRQLNKSQLNALKSLAKQAINIMTFKKSEKYLKQKIEDKNTLLKEVHHRVKNNFQLVSSLLSLQAAFVDDAKTKALFRYIQYRINSQVVIHELLYESADLNSIDLNNYVHKLVTNNIKSMKGSNHNFKLDIDFEPITLNINTSIPLGLIINEIVTNALKYGIKNNNNDLLYIKINRFNAGTFLLKIGDNGPGINEQTQFRNSNSLGLELVHSLVLQLKGNIERDNSLKGTHYIIAFQEI